MLLHNMIKYIDLADLGDSIITKHNYYLKTIFFIFFIFPEDWVILIIFFRVQQQQEKMVQMKFHGLVLALALGSSSALTPREELAKSVNDLKTTWTAKVGSDANKPLHSSRHLYGVLESSKVDFEALPKAPKLTREEVEAMGIPHSFQSAENWPQCAQVINDIRDQSNCGEQE
jgi:hypothetical protein